MQPVTLVPIINTNNESGKRFLSQLEELLNTKNRKRNLILEGEDLEKHSFVKQVLQSQDPQMQKIYDDLIIKRVSIGSFGRKNGSIHRPLEIDDKEKFYFRFLVHLGPSEVYYLSNQKVKQKAYALKDGEGFIISPLQVGHITFTVFSNHIRLIDDPKVQASIPKIRPLDYKRIVLVYDLEYIVPDKANIDTHMNTDTHINDVPTKNE